MIEFSWKTFILKNVSKQLFPLIASEGSKKMLRMCWNFGREISIFKCINFQGFQVAIVNEGRGLINLCVNFQAQGDMRVIIDSGLASVYSKHTYVTHAKYVSSSPDTKVRRVFCFYSSCFLASVYCKCGNSKRCLSTGVGFKSKNTCQWTAVATLSHVFVIPKNLEVGVCKAKCTSIVSYI